MTMYANSPNNSTTSLSGSDDDEVKDGQTSVYPYYPKDVTPAQWSSSTRGQHPQTPPTHSAASHLPPEILIHVLRQIHSPRDLHSSLLVSRAWCECAVELLWHRPSFTDISHFVQMLKVISSDEQTFDYPRFVRRLNFIPLCRELTDALFTRLEKCVKLERLTLVNCIELSDDVLSRVLPMCSNLVALDLTNITSCTDRSVALLARSATKLQGLNLGGCKNITDEGVLAIAEFCPLLRRIKLSNVKNITDRAVSALARKCSLLLEIDLHGCPKVTDEAVRDLWTYLTHLRDFRLAQCSDLADLAFPTNPQTNVETQLGVQPFPNSMSGPGDVLSPLRLPRLCEHLRMLDLTSCALITDDAIAGIVANAPKIRNLYLAKCSQLTDAAVESICKLGKHLHYLHLGHASSITDRSVRTLARSCARLRYIDLACCLLLTDMSVFELSGLPKLRRIGLVRVTNLTDQAIFALADRHSTLERIHLSYCENITVLAVHFLLQRLVKLTHLSLTGVPAFRRQELQQFCRSPPREFNTNQRAAFCVYSGKGVDNLRVFLAGLMADVQAEADTGDNDTEYFAEEEEEDFQSWSDRERGVHVVGIGMLETPRVAYAAGRELRIPSEGTIIAHEELFEDSGFGRTAPITTIRSRVARTVAERTESPEPGPLLVEDINPSSVSTTPSPTVQPSSSHALSIPGTSNRLRGFGQDLIVEPSTPSPQLTPYASRQGAFSGLTFVRASSHASDEASNRSAHSSGTNNTNTSALNGAAFFRSYETSGSSSDAASTARGGTYTPDLVYAEIGHGKGGTNFAEAGPSRMQETVRHSQSSSSSPYGEASRPVSDYLNLNGSGVALQRPLSDEEGRHSVVMDTSDTSSSRAPSRESNPMARLTHRDHHDPLSPIPYLSSSPTTRELQESVHSALTGSNSSSGIIQEDAMSDSRGRSVRRSLKNTLNVAEHYASALFFGRAGSSSSSARDRAVDVNSNNLGSVPNGRSQR